MTADPLSSTQLPPQPRPPDDAEAFQQGLETGRALAQTAVTRVKAWAEANPGQFILAGLAAGFVLGKLLLSPPRRRRFID